MPYQPLDRIRITRALRRLGELAQAQRITFELSLYGGAVFTLVYGSRAATKDVDAVVRPSEVGRELARTVAAEQDLPEDWLNDAVRLFLSKREAKRSLPADEFGAGLRIVVPTAAYLLAMKLRSCLPPCPAMPATTAISVSWCRRWASPRSRRPRRSTTSSSPGTHSRPKRARS